VRLKQAAVGREQVFSPTTWAAKLAAALRRGASACTKQVILSEGAKALSTKFAAAQALARSAFVGVIESFQREHLPMPWP